MQFKHPELLYFLFLLIIPILVHLFQLRRFKKEYFTNVRFLRELSIQTRKSSKLKKWLLLATRLLLLATMIVAFAQPFYQAKDSRNATNEMFIVLDNSFSMQAAGNRGELLKRAIEDLLQSVPENQSFSLITNDENFWDTDIKSIRRDLQGLRYSSEPFNLERQMARVNSRKSNFNKDIVVITDLLGVEQSQIRSINNDYNASFVIPKSQQKNNVSVDSVYISQTIDRFYELSVVLSRSGESDAEISISLYNQGKLSAKTTTAVERQKILKLNIPKEDFHGYLSIQENGLPYDNVFYFSISNPEKLKVISIGDESKSAFLSRIYTPLEFEYQNSPLASLNYNTLEKQDVIIINELPEIPQALQTTLRSFFDRGGNVIIIPSAESDTSQMNGFIGQFGKVNFRSISKNEKRITKIAFGHALYSGVFEKKIDNFQYPKVESSFELSGNVPAILGYEDQSPFLVSVNNAFSSVYIFSAALNKENSNFQNSPLIVPTFYNMAQTTGKTGVTAVTIGSGQQMVVDAAVSKDEILSLRKSDNQTDENLIPGQQALSNKVRLTFADIPKEAGNYDLVKSNETVRPISFNYARTEGNLQPADESILSDFTVADSIENVFDTLRTSRTENELWKWFVIITLILLLTEILIQKFVR